MARELIGFFNDPAEAQRVCDEAIAAGFDKDDIKVVEPGEKGRESGFWEKMKEFFGAEDEQERKLYQQATQHGATAVAVDADTSSEESKAIEIMQRHHPIDLDYQARQWGLQTEQTQAARAQTAQTQPTRTQPTQQTPGPMGPQASGEQVLPVVEEQLTIGKREVQKGGIRIHTITREKPVQQQVELREEHVTVERRPVDRPLTDKDRPFQERTIEVRETAEEAVVGKQAKVVEEVVINKEQQQRTQNVSDTVKRTDVEVEQLGPEGAKIAENYATTLSQDQRFHGREWDQIEPDVQRDFESRYPGHRWNEYREPIRRGWAKFRSNF